MDENKKYILPVIAVILALVSIFVLGSYASKDSSYDHIVESLDSKKQDVLVLTASTTAASATVTLLPDDVGTPIAEKLTDFSTDFLIVLCAIYLEKYLLTIIGSIAFRFIIPSGLLLFALNSLFMKNHDLQRVSLKLAIFGLLVSQVIPVSVKLSDMIETSYEYAKNNEVTEVEEEETEEVEEDEKEASNWIEKMEIAVNDFIESAKDTVEDTATSITSETTMMINKFIEAVAIMIVTSCVIPILVIVVFIWLAKLLLEIDIDLPDRKSYKRVLKENKE